MKTENFELLKRSLEQALAYERGEAEPGRVTIRQRPVKKQRINIMLDEDIIKYFKHRAARPHSAPYQTQINQALREVMRADQQSSPEAQMEEIAERIAVKVAQRLRPRTQRKAA